MSNVNSGASSATGSANEAIGSGMRALVGIGKHRRYSLGIGIALFVVFAIWAISDGGSDLFFQRVFDGLGNGFVYSAMALALVLIFKATGVVNFAQGEMAMMGAFIAYAIANAFDIPGAVGVLSGMSSRRSGQPLTGGVLLGRFGS